MQFAEARSRFAAARAQTPSERLLRLGEATALLNEPPTTRQRLARAAALLDELVAGPLDEAGIAARYLRARYAQLHAPQPDRTDAARRFRELITVAPHHPLAEQAAVKLALLELYRPGPAATADTRFASAEELLAATREGGAARRDLHLAIARAYLHFGYAIARALPHLIAANAITFETPGARADSQVTLHRLADEVGDRATATLAGRTFIAENPHDTRVSVVRSRVAELEAIAAP